VPDPFSYDPFLPPAALGTNGGAAIARFRALREMAWPRASYKLHPHFWTPAGRRRCSSFDPMIWPVAKTSEPMLTGMAWTARNVYLVVVAFTARYEQIGRLIHCQSLIRRDPDYVEHRGKRVLSILFCDSCSLLLADFARRHKVRIATRIADAPVDFDD
jgi:hypothetical protein